MNNNYFKKIAKKITLFDLILIGLVFFGVVFFAVMFFRKATYSEITIKVNSDSVLFNPWNQEIETNDWFAQLFRIGMTEKDSMGRVQAEVVKIKSYDIRPSRKAVYLTLKILSVYENSTGRLSYNGRPVLIGSPLKFNLDGVVADGLVTDIDGQRNKVAKEKLIVYASVREENETYPDSSGVEDYLANAIVVGTEIKDSNENVVIKILDKKVSDAKRLVTTDSGNVIVKTNPLRKDVKLVLETYVTNYGGRYYLFDDAPIVIGERIPVNTDKVTVFPYITDFQIDEN